MPTVNTYRYRKFHEVWTFVVVRYVSGQTDRQTDILIAILRTPTEEIITNIMVRIRVNLNISLTLTAVQPYT